MVYQDDFNVFIVCVYLQVEGVELPALFAACAFSLVVIYGRMGDAKR